MPQLWLKDFGKEGRCIALVQLNLQDAVGRQEDLLDQVERPDMIADPARSAVKLPSCLMTQAELT